MNYTNLKTNIQDICETTFTDAQLELFTQQAEQKIYNSVQFPALRKNQTGSLSSGNKYLTLPADFLWTYSLAIESSSEYIYLLNKDVNFIREAYPNPSTTGIPKHYAYFTDESLIVGPTHNTSFTVELHYGYYPTSIVTAGTSWLGTDFDSALLNGALVEAIRFMKGEADMVQLYQQMYLESLTLLGTLGENKLREDSYRSGQYKMEVA